jgi:hypothetical protein
LQQDFVVSVLLKGVQQAFLANFDNIVWQTKHACHSSKLKVINQGWTIENLYTSTTLIKVINQGWIQQWGSQGSKLPPLNHDNGAPILTPHNNFIDMKELLLIFIDMKERKERL